ncbi:MAG: hypothetical protein KDE46_14620 [Caldilineaceae bacterium]|nr:hypothetical protein [Caldilineaceae bacterium]
MILEVDKDIYDICQSILREGKDKEAWSKIESDDMFQFGPYIGGYDATESAFCFSYYDEHHNEFWFQLTLTEIEEIAEAKRKSLYLRPAE